MTSPLRRVIGRYVLFDEIATGGMATVHFGRMIGPAGFARTVAIKRLHPQFAKDPEFVSMFLDEARLAARISHLHVVTTLDIVAHEGELLLVMEYVQGVALSYLARVQREKGEGIPPAIAAGVLVGAALGLHAAHEATSDHGTPLDVVHRDVSPQNILVGVDGAARVADFGIAKAVGRLQTTREGQIKGKSGYMAPEQIRGRAVDRRTDVYAASVVLWELLTGERLFAADSPMGAMNQVLEKVVRKPSDVRATVPVGLDAVVLRGLSRDPQGRYPTARDFALALEGAIGVASAREIGEWLSVTAAKVLSSHAERVAEIESSTSGVAPTTGAAESPGQPGSDALHGDTRAGAVNAGDPVTGRRTPGPIRLALAALFAGAVALGSLAGVRTYRNRAAPSAEDLDPSAASASPATPDSDDTAASSGAPSTPSVAEGPATGTPARSVDPRIRVRPHRPLPAKPPSSNPSTLRCNPPYTIDADGSRRWKDGC